MGILGAWNGRDLSQIAESEMRALGMKTPIPAMLLAVLFFGCSDNSGSMPSPDMMEDAEKKYNQRMRNELLIYMPIETMFPDPELRALAEAGGKGQLDEASKLLSMNVDINGRGVKSVTPLFWVLRSGNTAGFEYFLQKGANPDVLFEDGGSVVHWAASHANPEFLLLAIEYGANPNLGAGVRGSDPVIFDAIGPGKKDRLEILLEADADLNVRNHNGNTPVMMAAAFGQYDVVYQLLERGADYTTINNNGFGLADTAAKSRRRMDPENRLYHWLEKVINWLSERGVSVD